MAKAGKTSKKKSGKKAAAKAPGSRGVKATKKKAAKKSAKTTKKKVSSARRSSKKSAVKKRRKTTADKGANSKQRSGRNIGTMDVDTAKAVEQGVEIPRFDLAEQILAPERKVSSQKRKGPGKKPVKEARSTGSDAAPRVAARRRSERTGPESSAKQRIIAQIVARDIEKLRKGHH